MTRMSRQAGASAVPFMLRRKQSLILSSIRFREFRLPSGTAGKTREGDDPWHCIAAQAAIEMTAGAAQGILRTVAR